MALFSSYSWNWAVSAGPFSLGTKGAETCGSHYQLNAREKRVVSGPKLKLKLTRGAFTGLLLLLMQKGPLTFRWYTAIHSVVANHLWFLMSFTPFLKLPYRLVRSTWIGYIKVDKERGKRRRILPAISSATDPSGLRRSVRESEPAKREHKRHKRAAGPKKAPVADLSWTQFFLTPAPPPNPFVGRKPLANWTHK